MALAERTRIYEVLMRFGPDGAVTGMQCQYLTEVTRDGEVIVATTGEAVPIDAAGLVSLLSTEDRAAVAAAVQQV